MRCDHCELYVTRGINKPCLNKGRCISRYHGRVTLEQRRVFHACSHLMAHNGGHGKKAARTRKDYPRK